MDLATEIVWVTTNHSLSFDQLCCNFDGPIMGDAHVRKCELWIQWIN